MGRNEPRPFVFLPADVVENKLEYSQQRGSIFPISYYHFIYILNLFILQSCRFLLCLVLILSGISTKRTPWTLVSHI